MADWTKAQQHTCHRCHELTGIVWLRCYDCQKKYDLATAKRAGVQIPTGKNESNK